MQSGLIAKNDLLTAIVNFFICRVQISTSFFILRADSLCWDLSAQSCTQARFFLGLMSLKTNITE